VLLRTLAAFVTIAIAPLVALGAPTVPAPIAKIMDTVIQGTNADDPSLFAKLFTGDAVIVDENPPFVWRGADAGTAWWSVVDAVTRKAKLIHLKATIVRTGEFRQAATGAYLVQSMKITGVAARKPFAELGTLTYTFEKAGGKWLISSMVWTTKP
jgi:ketosteroid isomerase-like protein